MGLTDFYWFLGTFVVVYLFYIFFQVIRYKKYDPNRVPVELGLLIKKYKLDMKKINYRTIMNMVGLASAFDIAFASTFVFAFIKNMYVALLVGVIMLIPLILITFSFIGVYYVKKGMVLDGNKKN